MRVGYIFKVDAHEVISTMFWNAMSDHNIDGMDKDTLRCGVKVFCNDIQNYLNDYLGIDIEEHEHFDLDESDPSKWEVEKTVVHPKKGGAEDDLGN